MTMSSRTARFCALAGVMLAAVACGSAAPQRFVYGLYPSPAMQRDMTYSVYTPPNFTASERLPLVVLLHGALDDPETADEYGVGQVLDAHLARGDVPRVVIVVPQGDTGFWENWASGQRRYRDWVALELVPHVQRRYHTQACPEACHLMGVSMGGQGALAWAMAEPTRWASVSVISAPIFTIDEVRELYDSFLANLFVPVEDIWGPFVPERAPARNVYTRWQAPSDVGPFSLLVTWGSRDAEDIRETSRRFESHLKAHHIAAQSFEFDGEHSWKSWRDVFPIVLAEQVTKPQVKTRVKRE